MQNPGIICLTRNDSLWKDNVVRLEKSDKTFVADAPILFSKRTKYLEQDWEDLIKEFDKKFSGVEEYTWENYYIADIREAMLVLDDIVGGRERREYAREWLDGWGESHRELRKLTEEYESAFFSLEMEEPFLAAMMQEKFKKYKKDSAGLDWKRYHLDKLKELIELTKKWTDIAVKNEPFTVKDFNALESIKNCPEEDSDYVRLGEKVWLERLSYVAQISPLCARVLSEEFRRYKNKAFMPTASEKRRDFTRGWKLNELNSSILNILSLLQKSKVKIQEEKKYAPGGEGFLEAKKHFEGLQ
nr:hypothetical protein [Marseillevirus cajuinensis]